MPSYYSPHPSLLSLIKFFISTGELFSCFCSSYSLPFPTGGEVIKYLYGAEMLPSVNPTSSPIQEKKEFTVASPVQGYQDG